MNFIIYPLKIDLRDCEVKESLVNFYSFYEL